jgi:hypothetical protein
MNGISVDWHRAFVSLVKAETGCTHDQAFSVLGKVIDMREHVNQAAFSRGYNVGHSEARDHTEGKIMASLEFSYSKIEAKTQTEISAWVNSLPQTAFFGLVTRSLLEASTIGTDAVYEGEGRGVQTPNSRIYAALSSRLAREQGVDITHERKNFEEKFSQVLP